MKAEGTTVEVFASGLLLGRKFAEAEESCG